MKYDIFISYRRYDQDGRPSGRDIARTLKYVFMIRNYSVFFDYSELKDGDFESVILSAIEKSQIVLVVITKDTFARCSDTDDWVYRELKKAVSLNKKIILVDIDNAFHWQGWPKDFPDDLKKIRRIEISPIHTDSTFEACIDLIETHRIKNAISQKEAREAKKRSESDKQMIAESSSQNNDNKQSNIEEQDSIANALGELLNSEDAEHKDTPDTTEDSTETTEEHTNPNAELAELLLSHIISEDNRQ